MIVLSAAVMNWQLASSRSLGFEMPFSAVQSTWSSVVMSRYDYAQGFGAAYNSNQQVVGLNLAPTEFKCPIYSGRRKTSKFPMEICTASPF